MDDTLLSLQTATDQQSISLSKTVPLINANITPILYCLHNLSKFQNQVLFVDTIYERMSDDLELQSLFLSEIIAVWPTIPYNRKDKYYYFIGKLYSGRFNVLDFNCDNEIKQYIVRREIGNATLDEKKALIKRIETMKELGLVKCICDGLDNNGLKEEIKKIMTKVKCMHKRRILGNLYKRSKLEQL